MSDYKPTEKVGGTVSGILNNNEFKESFKPFIRNAYLIGYEDGYKDGLPKKGEWEYKRIDNDCTITCSECGYIHHRMYNFDDLDDYKRNMQAKLIENHVTLDKFCRNCGADMRKGNTE